jgi:acetyl-CoA carboxylase carboxyl transferase subunit alpha
MLENSIYSVISPEGCAAILWKDAALADRAAESLKLTSEDLLRLGLIDEIVPEPPGGAHADPQAAAATLEAALVKHIGELAKLKPDKLVRTRTDKYLNMGRFQEG